MEKIQVDFFNRDVCGGSQRSIYLYSMVLFWHNRLQGMFFMPFFIWSIYIDPRKNLNQEGGRIGNGGAYKSLILMIFLCTII